MLRSKTFTGNHVYGDSVILRGSQTQRYTHLHLHLRVRMREHVVRAGLASTRHNAGRPAASASRAAPESRSKRQRTRGGTRSFRAPAGAWPAPSMPGHGASFFLLLALLQAPRVAGVCESQDISWPWQLPAHEVSLSVHDSAQRIVQYKRCNITTPRSSNISIGVCHVPIRATYTYST